jgi:hypothetical protein
MPIYHLPVCHCTNTRLPRFRRAGPSTSLDKSITGLFIRFAQDDTTKADNCQDLQFTEFSAIIPVRLRARSSVG